MHGVIEHQANKEISSELRENELGTSRGVSANVQYYEMKVLQGEKDIDLEFLANKEDIEETKFPQYYDPKDVVDIRHANLSRGGLYIRKGAKRSRSQMIALINTKIADETRKIEWSKRQLEILEEKLVAIEIENLEHFYV